MRWIFGYYSASFSRLSPTHFLTRRELEDHCHRCELLANVFLTPITITTTFTPGHVFRRTPR